MSLPVLFVSTQLLGLVLRPSVILTLIFAGAGAQIIWVYVVVSGYRQRVQPSNPLVGNVASLAPSQGRDQPGVPRLEKGEFVKRYRLPPDAMNRYTNTKEFLIYGSLNNMEDFPELRGMLDIFAKDIPGTYWTYAPVFCPDMNTTIGLTVSMDYSEFRTKDAVVFGTLPKMLANNLGELLNKEPHAGQTWIYFSTESPFRAMRWVKDMRLASLKYHKLMTYNRKSDIVFPFGYTVTNRTAENSLSRNFAQEKSKLIAWMASNCEEIFWPRNEYVERMRELVKVDTYGRCGSIDCLPRSSERCTLILGQYKFYLALTNSECQDYITEKFWDTALKHDIVPVVGGAPREDYERVAPQNSFIHIGDFNTVRQLVDYLLLLDKNDAMYNTYFEWKQTRSVVTRFPPKPELFCSMVPHLTDGRTRVKKLGKSPWFKTCRNGVTMDSSVRARARVLDNNFNSWTPWRL